MDHVNKFTDLEVIDIAWAVGELRQTIRKHAQANPDCAEHFMSPDSRLKDLEDKAKKMIKENLI